MICLQDHPSMDVAPSGRPYSSGLITPVECSAVTGASWSLLIHVMFFMLPLATGIGQASKLLSTRTLPSLTLKTKFQPFVFIFFFLLCRIGCGSEVDQISCCRIISSRRREEFIRHSCVETYTDFSSLLLHQECERLLSNSIHQPCVG